MTQHVLRLTEEAAVESYADLGTLLMDATADRHQ